MHCSQFLIGLGIENCGWKMMPLMCSLSPAQDYLPNKLSVTVKQAVVMRDALAGRMNCFVHQHVPNLIQNAVKMFFHKVDEFCEILR